MIEELEDAFITFIRTHQKSLYRLAYSYTKSEQDALDVVQDSIQKGWLALDKLTKREQMKSWFYTILVRTAIDFLRKHKRVELIGDDALLQFSEQDTYSNLDLQQALHHLPLQLREVVVLRYFEEARMVLDCKKLFKTEMTDSAFIDRSVRERWYNDQPGGGFHTIYVVEIEDVYSK